MIHATHRIRIIHKLSTLTHLACFDVHTFIQAYRQTGTQCSGIDACRHADMHAGRQACRQAGGQAGGQAGKPVAMYQAVANGPS